MPARSQILRLIPLFLGLSLSALPAYDAPAQTAPRPFRFASDTFAFANETVWNYVDGTVHAESPAAAKRRYTRHCFVLTRAAVQFWKFARFDSSAPRLTSAELADRIRDVTSREVWRSELSPRERIVFPGYRNLREISASFPGIFQANIGLGWPVYFRAGNMPIVLPVDRGTEARLAGEIDADLERNHPTIVWLYNFPSLNLNHVVVVFAGHRDGRISHYRVYDPNYADEPKQIDYDRQTRSFSYQPTFFYRGGPVTARAVYRGVLQ